MISLRRTVASGHVIEAVQSVAATHIGVAEILRSAPIQHHQLRLHAVSLAPVQAVSPAQADGDAVLRLPATPRRLGPSHQGDVLKR